ncbi:MAG TPA: T9SS type A sorting domain-containing protein [Flavipsychrobacter sp.]|nr:T9SS type A sorting domain-containing protein [Flavipsychrobacter sp.]
MKKFILTIAACGSIVAAQAQTATDFTATDCNSTAHNLYSELASGKVVVLTWVMPCGSCVSGGNAAENAVQSFATSHPGKVSFWLIDDFGDTPCGSLSSWANSNGITTPVFFGNAGNAIDENDFGGSGMPHVVVISPDKTILYNKKNGATNDEPGITAAIAQGLTTLSVAEIKPETIDISPNPATGTIRISYVKAIKAVKVIAANGQVLLDQNFNSKYNPSIDIHSLATGIYNVVITDIEGRRGTQQIVKQ